nr:MAG TPA: Protein of unknown function (DUF2577) [Caudoviricetes sp.]
MYQGVILQVSDYGNKSLVQLIKQCAMDAFRASKPCNTYIGKVTKVNPLKVSVDQKMIIDADFLDVCESLTDHKVPITVGDTKKTYTIHNSLKKGDIVLLIRQQGGQKYTIIDRIKKGAIK